MKTFDRLIRCLSKLALATTITIGVGVAVAQDDIGFDDNGVTIETELLQTLQIKGSSAFYVHFAQQADVSAVYAHPLDWEERGQYVYDTLVATAESSQAEARQLLDAKGLKHTTFLIGNLLYVHEADIATVQALARIPGVTSLTLPKTYQIVPPIIGKDPGAQNQPSGSLAWGIVDTKADQFWSTYEAKGAGIVVASIDTGVQWDHPALAQAFKCGPNPADPKCWKDPSNICGTGGACDNSGHGTHTMGTMVGDDDPVFLTWQAGMAPDAKWIACKGCETGTSCSDFALNSCADWLLAPGGAVANRPHIVNNSWGGGGGDTWYLTKVEAWRAAGIFPAFSAGNKFPNGCSTLMSPGDYQASFASAAHDSGRLIAAFSSRGPSAFGHDPYTKANLSAPGVSVCSSVPGNKWSCGYSGTSMASPHSAGAVALLWSCNASLIGKIDATFQALQAEADTPPAGDCGAPPDDQGNYTYGYGYLNVLAAGAACAKPGKLVVNPTSLSARLKLGKTQTLLLTLSNTGERALTFAIAEQSVTTEALATDDVQLEIPPFTGVIPVSEVAASIDRAPDRPSDLAAFTGSQPPSLGILTGAPAYAMDLNDNNFVKIPNVDVPGTWTVVANMPGPDYASGDFIGSDFSKLYVLNWSVNQLYSLSTTTGATTVIGASIPRSGEWWGGMSGGSNGVMYASSTSCAYIAPRSTLYKIDLKTGVATEVGEITNGPCIADIAITPDATAIYGVDLRGDQLVRIEPDTGAGTVVGSVGIDAQYGQGLDFDDVSGVLYWAAYSAGSRGEMRVIDTKTGNSALVGAFPRGVQTSALSIATSGVVSWLDETPKSGTLQPGARTVVNVTVKANLAGMKPGVYKAKLNIKTNTFDGTIGVPVEMTVIDARDLAVDFGSNGLWIYTLNDFTTTVEGRTIDAAWDKINSKNASAIAGWAKGLAADFDTDGLYNYNGTIWTKIDARNVGNGGLAGWSKGLAADFDALGLWNYNGTTWTKIDARNVGNGGLASWSKGLAADFDALGLWSYNGTTWTRIDTRNVGAGGLAGWSKGLAADFDALGLWNYNGTTWTRIDTRNVGTGGLAGWSKGLAADFDALGLWNYNGTKWTRLTTWNPGAGGMSESAAGLTVDFDGGGVWNYDGLVWRRLVSGMDAQGVTMVKLP